MHIRTSKKPTKVNLPLVKKAINWYASQLLSKRLKNNITINLKFTENLYKETKCLAYCTWEDDNLKPREFEIEIDANLSQQQMLKSLAHEMVHVKQYATGQLKDLSKSLAVKWEGEYHSISSQDTHEEQYWFSPWEIEANGREVGLYVLFKKSLKSNRK